MERLSGKVAIITGVSSGMGRAQIELFLKEGASVFGIDVNGDALKKVVDELSPLGKIATKAIDISNKAEVDGAIEEAVKIFGKIDIVVNTAGVFDQMTPSLNTDEALWNRIIDINLKGTFFMTNAVLQKMVAQGYGNIVNVASEAGIKAGAGGAAYTASKHGVVGYTKEVAFDYGSKGIRANIIAPGSFPTPMIKEVLEANGGMGKQAAESVPLRRLGNVKEVAELTVFLASDEAPFITGAVIPIDGGLSIQ